MLPGFLQPLLSCLYSAGKHRNCSSQIINSPNPVNLMENPISFNGPALYSTKKQLRSSLMLTPLGINPCVNFKEKGLWTGHWLCVSTTHHSTTILAVPCACCPQRQEESWAATTMDKLQRGGSEYARKSQGIQFQLSIYCCSFRAWNQRIVCVGRDP